MLILDLFSVLQNNVFLLKTLVSVLVPVKTPVFLCVSVLYFNASILRRVFVLLR